MDLDMSIAALSVDMTQSRVGEQLGISVLKEAMTAGTEGAVELLSSMPESLEPDLGTLVDKLA